MARDCGLIDEYLSKVDVDLIFTRFKPRGVARLGFRQFLDITEEWAKKKGVSHGDLVAAMLRSQGKAVLQ